MTDYKIEKMTREELDIAVNWAGELGWNPGSGDADCFYQCDPNGFFIGRLNDEIISTGSAVCYDNDYAFCGFYIVKPEYRGKGYGMALTQARLGYVGDRITGLDGVLDKVHLYERLGYKKSHQNTRFQGAKLPEPQTNNHILPINKIPLDELLAYDRQCFPAPRQQLLNCWVSKPQRLALAYRDNKCLRGFGVLRPASEGHRIGPLFADNQDIANELLLHLVKPLNGSPFYIDIPDNNPDAMALVQRYQWQSCFATARMYRNGRPNIHDDKVYAITNFELG